MNYLEKYNQLMSSAKSNEPSEVVGKTYFGRKGLGPDGYHHHHIKPRCEGGDDSADNIVTLPIEDHVMAHWLYAKQYGGVHWASVIATANSALVKDLCEADMRKVAAIYAEAMRKRSNNMKGAGNHFYGCHHEESTLQKIRDNTEYQFFNFDGSKFTGTRKAFKDHTGIDSRLIAGIISGDKKTSNGWFTLIGNPSGQTPRERMKSAWRDKQEVVTLYHKNGDIWTGFPVDAPISYTNLDKTNNVQVGGWFKSAESRDNYSEFRSAKAKNAAASRGDVSGKNNPMSGSDRRKDIAISVYNKKGDTFVGSSKDFADIQGFSTSQYGSFIKIMRGMKKTNGVVIKSYKGWYPA